VKEEKSGGTGDNCTYVPYNFITNAKKMRTQPAAVKKIIEDFDAVLEAVIVEAVALAKAVGLRLGFFAGPAPASPRRHTGAHGRHLYP